jgi:hypothetical protein
MFYYIKTIMSQKSKPNFYCECCDYTTSRKSDYNKHLATDKHKLKQNKTEKSYDCECGKSYSLRSSLFNHKKSCKFILNKKLEQDKTEFLLNEIKQLKQIIQDQSFNQIICNNSNINSNNTNNFNINLFLDEKCKNAENFSDFINRIKQSINQTISQITNTNLNVELIELVNKEYNKLDDYKKPFYPTDKARNSLYIKDNDIWDKDNGDLLYDKTKVLQKDIIDKKLNNFTNSIDMDNMTDKQKEDYCKLISNATKDLDKSKIVKNICGNGVNPKEL